MTQVDKLFPKAELRERATNYIQLARNIVDSYPNGLFHGVQKDAIQNGWDAAIRKTKSFVEGEWGFEFALQTTSKGGRVFSMTDFGTSGLTGKMTSADEYSSEDLPEDERWARWESLAFTKGTGLGARGQGKMIFIAASNEHTIFYDSLRLDGTYRFGGTTATERGCPIFHKDETEGKELIQKLLGLSPIKHQGTRVIIMDPVDELLEALQNGTFLAAIGETWWPNIQKYGAKITVEVDDKKNLAEVPDFFPIPGEDRETENFKVWHKSDISFSLDNSRYLIKRICLAANLKQEVPEDFRGVALFRDGMKVSCIEFPNRSLRSKVYGYVGFDQALEEPALREIEESNHYGFKPNEALWRKIKAFIEDELEAFGNKKLGLGLDRRAQEARRRTSAESRALIILRSITKDWALSKKGPGLGGRDEKDNEPPDHKIIGVRLSGLNFPNSANVPRVDYGNILEDFKAVVFNRTDISAKLKLHVIVLSGDRKIIDLENSEISLKPHSGDKIYGPYKFKIIRKVFTSLGEYKLRVFIIDSATKTRVDEVTRRFWVETDPPLTGPFDVKGRMFSEVPNRPDLKDREWTLESEGSGKFTLFYNFEHLAYLKANETAERLTEYLSELFCLGAIQLVIRRIPERGEDGKPEVDIKPFDKEVFLKGNLQDFFIEISRVLSQAKGQIYKEV